MLKSSVGAYSTPIGMDCKSLRHRGLQRLEIKDLPEPAELVKGFGRQISRPVPVAPDSPDASFPAFLKVKKLGCTPSLVLNFGPIMLGSLSVLRHPVRR